MAPTLTHVHNVGKNHIIPQHSHSMSITHTKGLLNGPGQNNCFLNSAVQVLWHLDIFRRSFRELCGHACMAESCIFCALKELFAQFQYSHESALPPDALRRALAETFFNQQRFQLGFMDDAAECFENILLRIHFHIANKESEDMCNATHCIPHQKFAMTLVEQSVCHACGATSEPLSFTQMVHYVTSSTLCAQSKLNRESGDTGFLQDFGQLLRKAGGMGEIRDCPSACGAKIQIQRTLMNHPEIVSIGIVWDSERPTLEHIMDVFHTIGGTIRLQDVFHSVVDDRWGASTVHQLVGIVTYYGKHYSTFFFHTKLRVWIYFDDATVREIGPRWEQVVEKCLRGHFQPLLLLFANPLGDPVTTESAPKTVTYVHGHPNNGHHRSLEKVSTNQKDPFLSPLRRAMTPNPEKQRDTYTDIIPRRAITPNPELHANGNNNHPDKTLLWNQNGVYGNSFAPVKNNLTKAIGGSRPLYQHVGSKNVSEQHPYPIHSKANNAESSVGNTSIYNGELLQNLMQKQNIDCLMRNGHGNNYNKSVVASDSKGGPLRANGYFNNCDVIDGYRGSPQFSPTVAPSYHLNPNDNSVFRRDLVNNESIYISRKAVENVLNYQKKQRHRSTGSENNDSAAGSRNSNSSLESFENALRLRSHYNLNPCDIVNCKQEVAADLIGITSNGNNNVPRCRDSGNWSGDRNSASSASSTSIENPYFLLAGNKRPANSYRGSLGKSTAENGVLRSAYDAGYDSFSLSSNDSFPVSFAKHNQQLAQIPENPNKINSAFATQVNNNQTVYIDECHSLCLEADKFLEKSMENERNGDIDGAISLCNGAAAKARAAMDAPYSNPQILILARMKHNSCVMRARTLHRRILVRHDSISSHGSSSTGTDMDSPHKAEVTTVGHHSRQSSRDSTRSRNGNHSRQSSRDGNSSHNHSRQGSKDAAISHSRQNSQETADKKRIELYGTLPKRNSKKKTMDKVPDGSFQFKNDSVNCKTDVSAATAAPVTSVVKKDTRIPRRTGLVLQPSLPQQQQQQQSASKLHQHADITETKQSTPLIPVTDVSSLSHRDWFQPADQNKCLQKQELPRKPTLHRTNSVPSNYVGTDLSNSQSCTDISSSTNTTKDDPGGANKGSGAKLGKKQHKIRRKLLMGGLIRRKNRSMPDLREGQDTSPSPESSQRCYDDSGLQQPQLSMQTFDNGQSNASLSCHNLYYASQRHHSSHGKIPPPPPVRTTSQLSTRSQSHNSLVDRGTPATALAGLMSSVVPPNKYSTLEKRVASHLQQSQLRQASHKVLTQADVHHERTPSDGVKHVRLVRTLSCREPHIQRSSTTHTPLVNGISPLIPPSSVSSHQPPPPMPDTAVSSHPPPPLPPHQDDDVAVGIVRNQRQTANDTVSNSEGSGCGLLEQLLSKRQQMMDNPSKTSSSDAKSQPSKSDDWLQELQVRQQQILKKKQQGCLPKKPLNNTVSTMEDTSNANGELAHGAYGGIMGVGQISQVLTDRTMHSESKSDVSYKQKSVRDLASKFEQINVSPPVSSQMAPVSPPPPPPPINNAPRQENSGKSESLPSSVEDFNDKRAASKLQQHKQLIHQVRTLDLNNSGRNLNSQRNTNHQPVCVAANKKLPMSSPQQTQHQNICQSNQVNGNMYQNPYYNVVSSPINNMQEGYGQLHHHRYQQQQQQQQHQIQQQHQHRMQQQQHYQQVQQERKQQCMLKKDSAPTALAWTSINDTDRSRSLTTPQLSYRELGLPPPPYPSPYPQAPVKSVDRNGVTNESGLTQEVCAPKALPDAVDSNTCHEVDSHNPTPVISNVERTFQRKKSKKSVTFSDQIALVACADDHDGFSLLNPLLEKVLQKSTSNNSSSGSGNVAFAQQQQQQATPVNYSKTNGHQVGLPLNSENGNGLPVLSVNPSRSAIPTFVHNGEKQNRTSNSSHPWSSSGAVPSEVPCYLCRKKTVVPPVVYCRDCDFYMSRFKPKS